MYNYEFKVKVYITPLASTTREICEALAKTIKNNCCQIIGEVGVYPLDEAAKKEIIDSGSFEPIKKG
jgi:RNA-binding protein YhbY